MTRIRASGSHEQKVTSELMAALSSSLDIRVVLERAYPLLGKLVPADYGALGISSTGRAEDYQWLVENIPPAFFAAYPEMAPHDFVRTAVMGRLNTVLRDEEMIGRRELEANMMYRRAREVDVPLEQVMAVMLHVDDRWQSGLSLYRDRRHPFSRHERALLQQVTPVLANAVRNCHVYGDSRRQYGASMEWNAMLEGLLQKQGASAMLVAPPATELGRTDAAALLIERWFRPHERPAGRLPEPLAAVLAQAARLLHGTGAPARWSRSNGAATLVVSFVPLPPAAGNARWQLTLEEQPNAAPGPPDWQALVTRRERQVVEAVRHGWDNRLIADELGCRPATVTKHMSNIFNKLGVSNRTALVVRVSKKDREPV